MFKDQFVNKHLKKISQSQCFSKSVVLRELLNYLVVKSRAGESPKEAEIAYEIFGEKYDNEKEKNIRIYIYNLRKKLNEYYQREGLDDEIIFTLPKGAYRVEAKINRKVLIRKRMTQASPYVLLFSVLLVLLAVFVFPGKRKSAYSNQFIWGELYQSEYPLLMVLGDHYFVQERNALGTMSPVRYNAINSEFDYDTLINKRPELEERLLKTDQKYINKQGPFTLYRLMSFLGGGEIESDMCYSSELTWERVKGHNVLFIGSYKTQYILKDISEKLGIHFDVYDVDVFYQSQDSTYQYDGSPENFLYREYATFVRFKTNDQRVVTFLLCNRDIGNIAVVKYLSNPENLKKLEKQTANFPNENFKALFEVRGQAETDFELQLKHIDPIQTDINIIWP
ncbi:helix-turn-helix domain-containing protein [Puteibacter caeruleilacunae]|nr:helix-turn-helix domain-containing protein [Puteibacter caeruleilacunae]